MQRIMIAWRAQARLANAVYRLRSRALFYQCLLTSAHAVMRWRLAASWTLVQRDSLKLWQKAAHDQYVQRRAAEFRIQHKRKTAISGRTVSKWTQWRSAQMWLKHAFVILRKAHVVRVTSHVIAVWRRVSVYHALLARASAALIRKTLAKCARKAFGGLELLCLRMDVRHRAGDLGVLRHRSFLQHDALRVWSSRQKQSARYWGTVERRFMRYLSRVMSEWLSSAGRQRRQFFVCSASREKLAKRSMQACLGAWRWWCRVIARAFEKSCLVGLCLDI